MASQKSEHVYASIDAHAHNYIVYMCVCLGVFVRRIN